MAVLYSLGIIFREPHYRSMVYGDTTTYLIIILVVPAALLAGILIYRRTAKKQGSIVAVLREDASWDLRQQGGDGGPGAYEIYATVSLQNLGAKTTIRGAKLAVMYAGREYHPEPEATDSVELIVGKSVKQQFKFRLPRSDVDLTGAIDSATLTLTDTDGKDYTVTFEHVPRLSSQ